MGSNIFIVLFFAIGIIYSVKSVMNIAIEMRVYWNSKSWINFKEFLDDYILLKARKVDVVKQVTDDDTDEYLEIDLYSFKREKKANDCLKALGKDGIGVYNIERKYYLMVNADTETNHIRAFGGKEIQYEEKQGIFSIIINESSMIFEFDNVEMATFFAEKFNIENKVIENGHIFVDMSKFSENDAGKIRIIAGECYGEEVTDGLLVEKIKKSQSLG